MSEYLMDLMKPIRDDEDFKGAFRNVKNSPKTAKKKKKKKKKEKSDIQRSGSLDTLFSWLWERLNYFWTPNMSG